jgi:hypothetical protein
MVSSLEKYQVTTLMLQSTCQLGQTLVSNWALAGLLKTTQLLPISVSLAIQQLQPCKVFITVREVSMLLEPISMPVTQSTGMVA